MYYQRELTRQKPYLLKKYIGLSLWRRYYALIKKWKLILLVNALLLMLEIPKPVKYGKVN